MSLFPVPQGATRDDLLVERFRIAFIKQAGGREQWVDGTLELATAVLDAREDYPDHPAFSRWLARHTLKPMNKNKRTALLWMGENLELARTLLMQSQSVSPELVYRRHKNLIMPGHSREGQNAALPKVRKGGISSSRSLHDASGSQWRKRKRDPVIPTVMREDYVPGSVPRSSLPRRRRRLAEVMPPKERPLPVLKGLTREQVDPDFVGTPQEFVAKYGLVNLQTKEQIEYHKRQEALMEWLSLVSDHERTARALLAVAADLMALREWKARPGKALKLQGWYNAIKGVYEMLMDLEEKEVER